MRKYLRVPAAVLSLLILLLSFAGGTVSAEQAYTVNGVTVRYNDFSSSHNECWSYAYNFYRKIWGETLNSNFYGSENLLRNRSAEELTVTPEHVKEYVSQAVPGSVIRVTSIGSLHSSDFTGHSLVIVSIQSDGFTAFEGGLNAWPYCREHFYTWEEFCRTGWLGGRYGYIKYIKWPSASGEVTPPPQEESKPSADETSSQPGSEEPDESATLGTLETPELTAFAAGDLDRSGSLGATDYVMLKRYVNGTIRLTELQQKIGDLNGDGKVDEQDFRQLRSQLYAERILPKFSVPEMASLLLNFLF